MQLKRRYNKPEGWTPQYEGYDAFAAQLAASGMSAEDQAVALAQYTRVARLVNMPPVTGVSIRDTGAQPEQHFKRQRVEEALVQGWMSLGRGLLTIHAEEGDLVYTIQRVPGTYCCYCQAKLDDDVSGASGRAHITREHGDAASPDPSNPAGWLVTNAYECVLEEAAHRQWNAEAVAERQKQGSAAPASARPVPTPASPDLTT